MKFVFAIAGLAAAVALSTAATKPTAAPATPRKQVAPQRVETCRDSREAVPWYRSATQSWQRKRQATKLAGPEPLARGHSCGFVRRAALEWFWRAVHARRSYEIWKARIAERLQNPTEAIMYVFGPVYGPQALTVASCESGRGIYAQNGQYLGMFQMGSFARAKYGHDWTALGQARAAYAYFVDSGRDWSPWSCKPW